MGIVESYRPIAGRFQPGQVANPNGRPTGSRNKFGDQFYLDMAASWQRHGTKVMDEVAEKDPSTYLRVAASVIPKEISVAFTPTLPSGLDANDWAAVVAVARVAKAQLNLRDLKPEDAADHISRALAAYDAVTVIDAVST